jgi:hypothetical protein
VIRLELGPVWLYAIWRGRHYRPERDEWQSRGVRFAFVWRGVPRWRWSRGLRMTAAAG